MSIYIYGLVDPRDNRVRYVGKAIEPSKRLLAHLSLDGNNTFKDDWLRELIDAGLKPTIKILDRCEDFNWQPHERYWIAEYRKTTPDLTNIADGGTPFDDPTHGPKRECYVCREGKYSFDDICRHCDSYPKREREMDAAQIEFDKMESDETEKEISVRFAEWILKEISEFV